MIKWEILNIINNICIMLYNSFTLTSDSIESKLLQLTIQKPAFIRVFWVNNK
jgi:hypothetical protein